MFTPENARTHLGPQVTAKGRYGYKPEPRAPAAPPPPDPEAKFKPAISAAAKRMPGRSPQEMSTGDLDRRKLAAEKVSARALAAVWQLSSK